MLLSLALEVAVLIALDASSVLSLSASLRVPHLEASGFLMAGLRTIVALDDISGHAVSRFVPSLITLEAERKVAIVALVCIKPTVMADRAVSLVHAVTSKVAILQTPSTLDCRVLRNIIATALLSQLSEQVISLIRV